MANKNLDIKQLFAAGAHYGHKTSRWHPKMEPYIHSKRGGVHIIDLEKTLEKIKEATAFLEKAAAKGKPILFVGTKSQLRPVVQKTAESCAMPYVTERWLGGLLTNFPTMSKSVTRLKQLEEQLSSGELANKYSKLEVLRLKEEMERLDVNLGGIKEMTEVPEALVILDVHGEQIALREAKKLSTPVVGIVDSNTDPTPVDYPIPANDDAIKTVELIASTFAEAINEGRSKAKKEAPAKEDK